MTDAMLSLRSPFTELLNIEEELLPDAVQFHCTPEAQHLNSQGMVHGGVILALLDTAMASVARNYRRPLAAVTTNLNCNFFKAANGKLSAKARVVQATTTMVFIEADLYNDKNSLIAKASSVFAYIRKIPKIQDVNSRS